MGFDSLKLTITLSAKCYRCEQYRVGNLPTLSEADANGQQVVQWSNTTMTEESNGALLLYPITINVSGDTVRGYYMLFVNAVAQGKGATFYGWAQIPVAIMMAPG